MKQKRYDHLIVEIVCLEEDILCTSKEVADEANKKDNYFQDIWD